MEKEEKIEELKEKVNDVFENIAEKVGEEKSDSKKKIKPLVTSRVLFISILDKLYFIGLVLSFIFVVWGYVDSKLAYFEYGQDFFPALWSLIGGFLGILVGFAIAYFILNWLYRCVAKTMLCLTKNEIYGEVYVPFYRGELSVPISKVTKVDTIKVLWIFRTLIIHRYHQIPIVFATWNAQEFKDKLTELLLNRIDKVENEFESKSIFPEWLKKKIMFVLIFLGVILGIIIVAYTVKYFDNPFKKIPGTYVYSGEKIILNEDYTCNIDDLIDYEVTRCVWEADESYDSIDIDIDYTYEYKSSYSNRKYTYDRTLDLEFDVDDKVISYNWNTYKKEK